MQDSYPDSQIDRVNLYITIKWVIIEIVKLTVWLLSYKCVYLDKAFVKLNSNLIDKYICALNYF